MSIFTEFAFNVRGETVAVSFGYTLVQVKDGTCQTNCFVNFMKRLRRPMTVFFEQITSNELMIFIMFDPVEYHTTLILASSVPAVYFLNNL
jgi:hypothetical protein